MCYFHFQSSSRRVNIEILFNLYLYTVDLIQMENWKNDVDDWCRETFVTGKNTHLAVTSEYVSRVIDYLKSPEDREILNHLDKLQQAKFKFKVIIYVYMYIFC